MRFRTPALVVAVSVISALLTSPGAQAASAAQAVRAAGPASAPPATEGGRPVYSGGNRCTLGFNVRSGSTYYFLLVARCATVGATWYADPAQTIVLGTAAGTNGNISVVRYTNAGVTVLGSVHLYPGSQDIVSAGNPFVGQRVCRSGLTTGVRCGTVTALNQTVTFPEGTLTGLVRTSVCSEPGDGGGPFFSGTTALGLTVGGTGNCATGGVTYFQPILPALNAFGVNVF